MSTVAIAPGELREVLYCEAGEHPFERLIVRGRKPKNCPACKAPRKRKKKPVKPAPFPKKNGVIGPGLAPLLGDVAEVSISYHARDRAAMARSLRHLAARAELLALEYD